MNLEPLGDRVVIEPVEQPDVTEGGVLLPENAKEKSQTGVVLSVGRGTYQNGTFVPTVVKVGNTVMFARYSGTEIKKDGKKVLIVRESDILAIVHE